MSKQLKQYLKSDLKSRLGEDRDLIVVGLEKLTVERANDLRGRLREDGARMTGLRNRVARIAFDELGLEGLGGVVHGMSAVAHGGSEGALSVSRVLSDWNKKHRDGELAILGGFMEGKVLGPEDVKKLATMPTRDQLLSMIASAVVAPMQNIAGQLNELLAGVARAVDAVREQREGEEAA
jgi:large subunit ribosomal protein L10